MTASSLVRLHWVDHIPRDSGHPHTRRLLFMSTSYSFTLMTLWTLCTFRLSFCGLDPLFSSSYKLFCKNTRGWGHTSSRNSHTFSPETPLKGWLATINRQFPVYLYGTNIDAPYHLC